MNTLQSRRLPAEWEPQSGILLAWPSEMTDWGNHIGREEVLFSYAKLVITISQFEKVIVIFFDNTDQEEILYYIEPDANMENVILYSAAINDTWTRDFGAITVMENGVPHLLDFRFNGWGHKYVAALDNLITRIIVKDKTLNGEYENHLGFVLEGGSIESDGQGTILTTSSCLLSNNRNEHLSKEQIEDYLKAAFGATRVLWLDYGKLEGDDTDGHIDTLARFCSPDTIAYVQCTDPNHKLYHELKQMEQQLQKFTTADGKPYKLVPLPLPDPIRDNSDSPLLIDELFYAEEEYELEEEMLIDREEEDEFTTYFPASYANFLIINGAVLVPIYGQMKKDFEAVQTIRELFPDRKVIDINCRELVSENGALHCATMQFPKGVIK